MYRDAAIAPITALLAEPARLAILAALADGRALPAGELARRSRVTPQTASSHLHRLIEAGLLCVEQQGRHRYYRVAGARVVQALETLALLGEQQPATACCEERPRVSSELRFARLCYNHLAGTLGVRLAGALEAGGLIARDDGGVAPSDRGRAELAAFGVDLTALKPCRRPCLDWTERRHHLAGPLATAFSRRLIELRWIEPRPASRAVRLTPAGRTGLRERFGLALDYV
ncbi:MAG TPA: helix-turn-helix domain-containing protein [Dehalococcoidia bacterium]|nr:helix-turn-helix domain-containing protein [Dehalococcoidia bacterium]